MKKAFLLVLMAVMISTPCLAEVETAGLFSLDGTLWGVRAIECHKDTREFPSYYVDNESTVGFYQGNIYGYFFTKRGFFQTQERSYYDLFFTSIAIYSYEYYLDWASFLAIIQPTIGFGVFKWIDGTCAVGWGGTACSKDSEIGIMYKINDNWTPPEVE